MNVHLPVEFAAGLAGLILTVFSGLGLLVNAWFKRLAKSIETVKVDSKTAAVESAAAREQVKNTHDTNLREDLDKVLNLTEHVAARVDVLNDSVQVLKDALETSRIDRHDMHRTLTEVQGNVGELKTMYSEALVEHSEMWDAISRLDTR